MFGWSLSRNMGIGIAALVGCNVFNALGPVLFLLVAKYGTATEVIVGYFLLIGGLSLFVAQITISSVQKTLQSAISGLLHAWFLIALLGLIGPLYYLLFIHAMKIGTVAETSLIIRIAPLFVIPLSFIFLGEQVRSLKTFFLGAAFCVIGVLVISKLTALGNLFQSMIFLALSAALIGAVQPVIRSYLVKYHFHTCPDLTKTTIVALEMIIGGILILIYALVWIENTDFVPLGVEIVLFFILGLGTVGLPNVLDLEAYKRFGSRTFVTLTSYSIPILSALFAYFLYGERVDLGPYFAAMVCILFGALLVGKETIQEKE